MTQTETYAHLRTAKNLKSKLLILKERTNQSLTVIINSSKNIIRLIEMKGIIIVTTFQSILIGLYIAFHFTLFSGMNPILDKISLAIMIAIFIWNLALIFREKNKKIKLVQLSILILAIVFGLYKAKDSFDSLTDENSRIYYQSDTELEN
ncbi:hypothetical protein [Maribacter dokdonensis]|uniref:hypothetical protein n=1 Tax=Maribacter dokdonensis TaxID=320912 RepID=UPI002AB0F4BD|nr:hypothetical protein [Maribacter dokdonensis]